MPWSSDVKSPMYSAAPNGGPACSIRNVVNVVVGGRPVACTWKTSKPRRSVVSRTVTSTRASGIHAASCAEDGVRFSSTTSGLPGGSLPPPCSPGWAATWWDPGIPAATPIATATATRSLCLDILRLLSTLVDGAGRSWAGWLRLYVPTSQCLFAARHRGGRTAPGRCPPTKREDDCGSELGPKCRQPAVRNLVDPLRASGYMRVSARIPPALWGRSSVGRALEWHSRGRGFDSLRLHSLLAESIVCHILSGIRRRPRTRAARTATRTACRWGRLPDRTWRR